MSRKVIFFGDVHIPYQNNQAVEVLLKTITAVKPDIVVCLGDLLDCEQFSTHPPTWALKSTSYHEDLDQGAKLLGRIQKHCSKLVMLEGNHEFRIKRWAARCPEGSGVFELVDPGSNLKRRLGLRYISYQGAGGEYPHYKVNQRLVAVHGWSCAKNAARAHLQAAQGRSVIFGHTHRADCLHVQNIWRPGGIIEARGAGCFSQLVPLYGIGSPVEWIHAFVLGYLGRHSDTLYTVPISKNACVLPSGKEIRI